MSLCSGIKPMNKYALVMSYLCFKYTRKRTQSNSQPKSRRVPLYTFWLSMNAKLFSSFFTPLEIFDFCNSILFICPFKFLTGFIYPFSSNSQKLYALARGLHRLGPLIRCEVF